jgi:hypothetical protein
MPTRGANEIWKWLRNWKQIEKRIADLERQVEELKKGNNNAEH